MAKRGAYLEHLAQVPMFSSCSKKELQLLARRTTDLKLDKGEVVVQEGRQGHEFFVIVDGKAAVTRGGKQVATLGPGDFFGELALLEKIPRNATVTAATPLEVVVLSRQEFDSAIEEVPTLAKKLLVGLARRVSELDAKA